MSLMPTYYLTQYTTVGAEKMWSLRENGTVPSNRDGHSRILQGPIEVPSGITVRYIMESGYGLDEVVASMGHRGLVTVDD